MTATRTQVTATVEYDYATTVAELKEFLGIPGDEELVRGVFADGVFVMTTRKKEEQ